MEKCLHALAGVRAEVEALNSQAKDFERQRDEALELNASLEQKLQRARSDYDRAENDLNAKIGEQRAKISDLSEQVLNLQKRIDALTKVEDPALPVG